tara:strand:+ start:239 stop:475 length:237 start_codon:yes stop_codon:yes gene_type:complete
MATRSRYNVQQMIKNNTIYTILVNETNIYSIPDPNKQNSTIIVYEFPTWFSEHISDTSQQKIIHHIKNITTQNLHLCC